jgi:hypothetical protein
VTVATKSAAKAETLVMDFEFERDTKNTSRFQEISDRERPAVGTLYVTKAALAEAGLGDAKKIKVTVEAVD